MTDIDRQLDCIGPLGPFPVPSTEVVEVGRFPVEIDGKWVTEFDDIECTEPHRVYSYSKAATGDE